MRRLVDVTLCAAVLTWAPVAASAQSRVSQSTPVTVTATIEAIDQTNRIVTLKGQKGNSVDVKAPDASGRPSEHDHDAAGSHAWITDTKRADLLCLG
jgi:hypothetical protein